jgi:hypothetical protein
MEGYPEKMRRRWMKTHSLSGKSLLKGGSREHQDPEVGDETEGKGILGTTEGKERWVMMERLLVKVLLLQ